MSAELLGRKINTVVFDLDGTFYDHKLTPVIWGEVRRLQAIHLLEVSGKLGPFEEAEIQTMQEYYVRQSKSQVSFTDAFIAMGGSLSDFLRIVDSADRPKLFSPDPDLHALLSQMHSSLQIGILSSSTERSVDKTCTDLLGSDWQKFFHNIHCLNTPGVNWRKPQPEAFRHILVTLGARPETAAMVGDDRQNDLVPSHSLGMLTVQVGQTDSPEADLQIPKVTDLINYLKFV